MPPLRIKQACPTPILKAKREKVKKEVPRQVNSGTRPLAIRLHGIRLHRIKLQGIMLLNIKPYGIKSQGIMPHGAKLPSISGLCRDLLLPIKVTNPRLTNPGTLKSCRRWRMINAARNYLFGCKA
jgi:hypothetical protein